MALHLQKNYWVLTSHIRRKNTDLASAVLYRLGLKTLMQKSRRGKVEIVSEVHEPKTRRGLVAKLRRWEKVILKKKIFSHPRLKKISTGGWATRYQQFLKPFLLIPSELTPDRRPVWILPRRKDRAPSPSHRLFIQSQLAFGTGAHPTTQMSAWLLGEALQRNPGASVLDMGCGTGVLAMAAAKLGAQKIVAVDHDPQALAVARENLEKNQISGIALRPHLKKSRESFSLIVANIGFRELLELKRPLDARLRTGGQLILSGILYRDCNKILQAYGSYQLRKRINKKGWSALLLVGRPFRAAHGAKRRSGARRG